MTHRNRIIYIRDLLLTRTHSTINTMATISVIEDVYRKLRVDNPNYENLDCLVRAGTILIEMRPTEEDFNRTIGMVITNLNRFIGE